MSHLEQRLENDLQLIRKKIMHQADTVQQNVNDAVKALQSGNRQLAYASILNDHPVNRAMREIDRLCHKFIAVHLPSGSHLRLLSSIIRLNIEIERIGDYAVVIARESNQLSQPPGEAVGRELDRLANETLLMLKQSVKSFSELNAELARSTILMSVDMEYNLDQVYKEVTETTHIENVKDIMSVFIIFTQLKRIADQAKNICEDTIFAVTGKQKDPKTYHILFIDRDNNNYAQLAEAIANKNYPDGFKFFSASKAATDTINENLIDFLQSKGEDTSTLSCNSLDELSKQEISKQHVIVCLDGEIKDYLSSIPFHTSILEWNITEDLDEDNMESIYRSLAVRISDLAELLHGNEV